MKQNKIKKMWKELSAIFSFESDLSLVTLSILIRLTYEKFNSKKVLTKYQIANLHVQLHSDMADDYYITALQQMVDILYKIVEIESLSEETTKNISKIISEIKKGTSSIEKAWWKFEHNSNENVIDCYVKSSKIITLSNGWIYMVVAEKLVADGKTKTISFFSTNYLKPYREYKITYILSLFGENKYKKWFSNKYELIDYGKTFYEKYEKDSSINAETLEKALKFIRSNNRKIFKEIVTEWITKNGLTLECFNAERNKRNLFEFIRNMLVFKTMNLTLPFQRNKYLPISNQMLLGRTPLSDIPFFWKKEMFECFNNDSALYKNTLCEHAVLKDAQKTGEYFFNKLSCVQEKKINNSLKIGSYQNKYELTMLDDKLTNFEIKEQLRYIENFLKESKKQHNNQLKITDELKLLNSNKLAIIYGPAGHGKTYAIQQLFIKNPDKRILIIAPSWKSLSVYGDNNNIIKKTYQAVMNDKNVSSKSFDLVVIDEFSMIEDFKFLHLITEFTNRNKNITIIISGDPKQIPPIHTGERFSWLINFANVIYPKCLINYETKNKPNWRITKGKEGNKLSQKQKDLVKLLKNIRHSNFKIEEPRMRSFFPDYHDTIDLFKQIESLLDGAKTKNEKWWFIVANNNTLYGKNFMNSAFKASPTTEVGDEVLLEKHINTKFHVNAICKVEKIEDGKSTQLIDYTLSLNGAKEIVSVTKGEENLSFTPAMFITAHKAQGSTIERVAVIIENDTVDASWLYSAASRCSKELKIFIPQTFKKVIPYPERKNIYK